jgi:hypothetical protein
MKVCDCCHQRERTPDYFGAISDVTVRWNDSSYNQPGLTIHEKTSQLCRTCTRKLASDISELLKRYDIPWNKPN